MQSEREKLVSELIKWFDYQAHTQLDAPTADLDWRSSAERLADYILQREQEAVQGFANQLKEVAHAQSVGYGTHVERDIVAALTPQGGVQTEPVLTPKSTVQATFHKTVQPVRSNSMPNNSPFREGTCPHCGNMYASVDKHIERQHLSTPTTSSTDDELRNFIKQRVTSIRQEDSSDYFPGKHVQAIMDAVRQDREAREAVLKADIAHAIGFCQGLGHPHTYLENRYPNIAAPDSKAKACIICGHTAEDEEGLCGNCKEEAKA
jgi:hypothetical protein